MSSQYNSSNYTDNNLISPEHNNNRKNSRIEETSYVPDKPIKKARKGAFDEETVGQNCFNKSDQFSKNTSVSNFIGTTLTQSTNNSFTNNFLSQEFLTGNHTFNNNQNMELQRSNAGATTNQTSGTQSTFSVGNLGAFSQNNQMGGSN